MKPSRLKALTAVCLLALAAAVARRGFAPSRPSREDARATAETIAMARAMNVRNMVTAVYLGPRLADTFLEVMVVVLAAYGMKFVRESS